MPSTSMRPFWMVSSWLMQRISVDLPEPDGPQIDDALSAGDGEIDVLEGLEGAVPLVDAFHDDGGLAVSSR